MKTLRSEQQKAHAGVAKAIKDGILTRPTHCLSCGNPDRKKKGPDGRSTIYAHHHDYSKPLEVQWVCSTCHANEHKRERLEEFDKQWIIKSKGNG